MTYSTTRAAPRSPRNEDKLSDYSTIPKGSDELIALIVEENVGWAKSIAKSVARAWNMDWELDGLDGGAYEGLLFCARRFDPTIGVPFRAYARRRIHESSTEEARKSKSWQRGVGANTQVEQDAREISARLFMIFPELREGALPESEQGTDSDDSVRSSLRQLLASATLLATFEESSSDSPEAAVEFKRMLRLIVELEPVHQSILWSVYWQGQSMRGLAQDWEIDELSIIREHKEILAHLGTQMAEGRRANMERKLKIRRGLRVIAQNLRKQKYTSPFHGVSPKGVEALLAFFIPFLELMNSIRHWS